MDDYLDIREVVADVLQNAGFVVRTAADGLEALIAAYEMRPGVIVMDVSMPVLDGLEATRLIKACAATRDARVIAYTGNPMFDESPTRMLFAAVLTSRPPRMPCSQQCETRRVSSCWCRLNGRAVAVPGYAAVDWNDHVPSSADLTSWEHDDA